MKVEADLANLDLRCSNPTSRSGRRVPPHGLLSTKLNVERAADGHLAVAGEVGMSQAAHR